MSSEKHSLAEGVSRSLSIWIWLYMVSRALLSPLYTILTWHKQHVISSELLSILYVVCGIAAAFLLFKRSRLALTMVATELAIRFVDGTNAYFYISFHPAHPHHWNAISNLVLVFLVVAPTILWALYFQVSEQVRYIFGRNLLPLR